MRHSDQARIINPTLVLFFLSFSVFVSCIAAGFIFHPAPKLSLVTLALIQTLNVFVMFTPLHDSVHFIASKKRFWNELVVWGTWPVFINFTYLFRKIHLSHHAKTNQGLQDPDHFTSHPLLVMRWARSFALVVYYYVYSLRNYGRNLREWLMMGTSAASALALILASFFGPYSEVFFWTWLLPSFVGTGFLAFANTAWPHHPGKETDRLKNTRILLVPAPLRWMMCNQNYHLVHHLKPNIPWYDYPKFWRENEERLTLQGAVVTDFTLSPSHSEPFRTKVSRSA